MRERRTGGLAEDGAAHELRHALPQQRRELDRRRRDALLLRLLLMLPQPGREAGAGVGRGRHRPRVLGMAVEHVRRERRALPQPVLSDRELHAVEGALQPLHRVRQRRGAAQRDAVVVEEPLAQRGVAHHQRAGRLAALEQLRPEERAELLPRLRPLGVQRRVRRLAAAVVREEPQQLRHPVAPAVRAHGVQLRARAARRGAPARQLQRLQRPEQQRDERDRQQRLERGARQLVGERPLLQPQCRRRQQHRRGQTLEDAREELCSEAILLRLRLRVLSPQHRRVLRRLLLRLRLVLSLCNTPLHGRSRVKLRQHEQAGRPNHTLALTPTKAQCELAVEAGVF